MRSSLILLMSFFSSVLVQAQEKKVVSTAAIFLPEKIATGNNERDMTISPDGNELFYTVQHPKSGYSQIVYMKKQGKNWSAPQIASFSGKYSDLEASFSPDGNKMIFG
jgi:Tol biopolymer transport system component